MQRKHYRFILLLLALLIPTAVVSAADSVTLGSYRIDLVSHEENADGSDTFTYAVTGLNATDALNHWSLGIETCVDYLVSPLPGPYTTVTDVDSCGGNPYQCQESNYTVETGNDPTLRINGIKFGSAAPQLSGSDTHIFQITVEELAYVDRVTVGIHSGPNKPINKIDGPFCGGGTAVSLASIDAGIKQFGATLPLLLTVVVLMAGATLFIWRRELAAARTK